MKVRRKGQAAQLIYCELGWDGNKEWPGEGIMAIKKTYTELCLSQRSLKPSVGLREG